VREAYWNHVKSNSTTIRWSFLPKPDSTGPHDQQLGTDPPQSHHVTAGWSVSAHRVRHAEGIDHGAEAGVPGGHQRIAPAQRAQAVGVPLPSLHRLRKVQ